MNENNTSKPVAVTVHVDPDVLAWFKAQGEAYERRMNAALRIYAEAHQGQTHVPAVGCLRAGLAWSAVTVGYRS